MKILTILILMLFPVVCAAQQEVYFNNATANSNEIRVEKLVQGFEFSVNPVRLLAGKYMGLATGSVETQLGYFHENRLSEKWTLYKAVSLGNAFYNTEMYDPGIGYGSDVDTKYLYNLSLNLKIEPRWYFDLNLRYKANKTIEDNSGWYMSLPVCFTTNLLQQPAFNGGWTPDAMNILIKPMPTIGYRRSFQKHWFYELNLSYIPVRFYFYKGSFFSISSGQIGSLSADSFHSEIKVAYVL